MVIYLAGGISGNLKPAWKMMAENTPDGFEDALRRGGFLINENVPGVSSYDTEVSGRYGNSDEDVFSGERDNTYVYNSDLVRGGL